MSHPKVIKSSVLYNRFGKEFVVDSYRADDGVVFDWAHLNSPNSGIVVAINSQNQFLLVKQYRFNLGTYTYEFPAGGSESGEDPKLTAQRELFEETGYESKEIMLLGRFYVMPSETNRWVNIFLAKNITKKNEPPLDSDVEKYFDMSLDLYQLSEVEDKLQGLEHLFALKLTKEYLKIS